MDLAVIPPLYGTGDVVNESKVTRIPGSREEAPDDLPGSWGEGRLKKIPLIERCEGIATNNGPESWGEGRLKKIPLIEQGDRHQQWSGSQLWVVDSS